MEITLFCFELIEVLILIRVLVKTKLIKTSSVIFYWLAINSFFSPVVYYVIFNGTSYRTFTNQELIEYEITGCIYFFSLIAFIWIISKIQYRIKPIRFKASLNIAKIASVIIIFSCLIYITKYRSGFPLLNFLRSGVMIDERPDTTGAIPHFFVFGTLMMMAVPMLLFYYSEIKNWSNYKFAIYTIACMPLLFISGNQGILVYFIMFLWMFKLHFKLSLKMILAFIMLLFVYNIIKSGSLLHLDIISPIRRFFVTQGAGIPNRIHMVNNNYNFDGKRIADEAFAYVYGYEGGSYPTFFVGDIIVEYGIIKGTLVSIGLTLIIQLIIAYIEKSKRPLYIRWRHFIILYLIGNSGFHIEFAIRFAILIAISLILYSRNVINSHDELSIFGYIRE